MKCVKCCYSPYKSTLNFLMNNHEKTVHCEPQTFDCAYIPQEDFRCVKCSFASNFIADVLTHIRSGHSEVGLSRSLYNCRSCRLSTLSKFFYTTHRCNAEFRCEHCTRSYTLRASLRAHTIFKHSAPESIRWLQCEHCPFKTKYRTAFNTHVNVKHAVLARSNRFQCTQCDYKTTDKNYLIRHFRSNHGAPEDIRWFQCDRCNFKTKRAYSLKTHYASKHANNLIQNQVVFADTECANSSESQSESKSANSRDVPMFQCAECEFRTKDSKYLKEHFRKNHAAPEQVRWYRCEQCDYRTKNSVAHLKLHITNKHTSSDDINWFHCQHCDYKSKLKGTLKQHVVNIHTVQKDIQWFQCAHCNCRTKHKGHLKRHMRKKHGLSN